MCVKSEVGEERQCILREKATDTEGTQKPVKKPGLCTADDGKRVLNTELT